MESKASRMTYYYSELKPKEKWKVASYTLMGVFGIGCIFILGLYVVASSLPLRSLHLPIQSSDNDTVSIDEKEIQFTAYRKAFGKKYDSNDQYIQRFNNFKESISEIEKLRSAYHGSAKYGLTKFSDMSKEEFKNTMLIDPTYLEYGKNDYNESCITKAEVTSKRHGEWGGATKGIPPKFDWRDDPRGVVGPVLNQGICGSCWAYCTVEIMESMVRKSNLPQRHLYSHLSIQELLDCCTYTDGCKGGSPKNALEFLCETHWTIVPADLYPDPLRNRKGSCKYREPLKHGVIASRIMLGIDMAPQKIAETVWTHGPVMATVNSNSWQFYLAGVIQYHCSSLHLNHVVQIVGYNMEDPDLPYFIIKNSWGTDWGDQGYVYIAMTGICGIGKQIGFLDVSII